MNELAITQDKLVEFLNLVGVGNNVTPIEKKQFLEISQAFGLNPYKKEIHLVKYETGCSIIVGYEAYIKRAEKTGMLDGYEIRTDGTGTELTATITIHRKDWSRPFVHTVDYSEYVQMTKYGQPNRFWKEKPKTMLKKVAISQGFRLAFSVEVGGMPYTKEEMPEGQELNVNEIVAEKKLEDNQLKRIHILFKEKGISEEQKEKTKEYYKVRSTKELTEKQATDLIEKLLKKPNFVEEKIETLEGEIINE